MDASWLLAGLVPALILVVLAVWLVAAAIGEHRRPRAAPPGVDTSRSEVLPGALQRTFFRALEPLVVGLARVGVRPDGVTLASLGLAVVAAAFFGVGWFGLGAWALVLTAACDALDGLMARRLGMQSEAGAFLDSFADRISEGVVYAGLAAYGEGGWLTWTSLLALLSSYAVSYARARGESLGVVCREGRMQRAERLVVLLAGVIFAPLLALWLEPGAVRPVYHLAVVATAWIGVGSSLTAFGRARAIYRRLGQLPSPGAQRAGPAGPGLGDPAAASAAR